MRVATFGGDVLSLTQPYLLSIRLEFSDAHWKLLLKYRQSSQTQSAKTELTFLLLPFLLSPLYFHFMFLAPLFTFLLKPAIQGTCKTSPSLCESQGTNRSNPLQISLVYGLLYVFTDISLVLAFVIYHVNNHRPFLTDLATFRTISVYSFKRPSTILT